MSKQSPIQLQDFIRETLVQIANGINEANLTLANTNATVNPPFILSDPKNPKLYGYLVDDPEDNAYESTRQHVDLIDFDVAVHASEGKQTKGGIGIAVATIGLGAGGRSDSSVSSESRIKFSIPMVLPHGTR